MSRSTDVVAKKSGRHKPLSSGKRSTSLHSLANKLAESAEFNKAISETNEGNTVPSADIKIGYLQKSRKSFSSITSTPNFKDLEVTDSLATELTRYKEELNECNNATKDLEKQYMKINVELSEMQHRNERFIAERAARKASENTDASRSDSEYSLKRKFTQIFHRGKDSPTTPCLKIDAKENTATNCSIGDHQQSSILRDKQQESSMELMFCQQNKPGQVASVKSCFSSKCKRNYNKENVALFETPTTTSSDLLHNGRCAAAAADTGSLENIYQTLKNVFNSKEKLHTSPITSGNESSGHDIQSLQRTIGNMQQEQEHFRDVIVQQQSFLHEYHSRCVKAQHIMQAQQLEIEKLTKSKKGLQDEVNKGIEQLRIKLGTKLREMAPLSKKLQEEKLKYEKIVKENHRLTERIRDLQGQVKDLKAKMEDLTKKKTAIFNRFKTADRDLKVFRNYNTALKIDKQKQAEEAEKLREQLENLQTINKRQISRQREISEKRCRDLQRRVYELEQKLGRSNNSTSSLLQDRDRLIAELQSQLNTLVHNFEVSQKHIRVLRRHIHNAADLSVTGTSCGLARKKT